MQTYKNMSAQYLLCGHCIMFCWMSYRISLHYADKSTSSFGHGDFDIYVFEDWEGTLYLVCLGIN